MENHVVRQIEMCGIVPVVVIDDDHDAEPLANALLLGGLPVMEITFRTAAAREAIKRVDSAVPRMLVGAGTVLNVEQAEQAIEAGAKFIVSPGFSASVVSYCRDRKVPIFPGIATPTEICMALDLGVNIVKFYPAEQLGGADYLKSLIPVFGGVKFIPTGGISESNLLTYLQLPSVVACGGSWMVKKDLVSAHRFDAISRLSHQAVSSMLGLHIRSFGKSGLDDSTKAAVAAEVSRLLRADLQGGQRVSEAGHSSSMNGHIEVASNFPERAIAFCEREGIRFRGTIVRDSDGMFRSVEIDAAVLASPLRLIAS